MVFLSSFVALLVRDGKGRSGPVEYEYTPFAYREESLRLVILYQSSVVSGRVLDQVPVCHRAKSVGKFGVSLATR